MSNNSKYNDVFKMALTSIFLALSVAIIYFGSVAVVLSSLLTVIAYEECSKRYAILLYFGTLLLSLFLSISKTVVIYYAFFGVYPILKYDLDKIKNALLRRVCKFFVLSLSDIKSEKK